VLDTAGFRVEAIHSVAGSDVDAMPLVLGETGGIVTGQTVVGRVRFEDWPIGVYVLDPARTALAACHPKAVARVDVQALNDTGRRARGLVKRGEPAACESSQATLP